MIEMARLEEPPPSPRKKYSLPQIVTRAFMRGWCALGAAECPFRYPVVSSASKIVRVNPLPAPKYCYALDSQGRLVRRDGDHLPRF